MIRTQIKKIRLIENRCTYVTILFCNKVAFHQGLAAYFGSNVQIRMTLKNIWNSVYKQLVTKLLIILCKKSCRIIYQIVFTSTRMWKKVCEKITRKLVNTNLVCQGNWQITPPFYKCWDFSIDCATLLYWMLFTVFATLIYQHRDD